MRVHFALSHMAAFRAENILDRIFQRDDVIAPSRINFIHQSRQRRRFSRADGARHQHQAIMILREQFQVFRQPDFVHRTDARINNPEHQIDSDAMPHHAGSETPMLILIGKIHVATFSELHFLFFREEAHRQPFRVSGSQARPLQPDRLQVSESPPSWLTIHPQMNVGRS